MNKRYVITRIAYALLILFIVISLNFMLPRLAYDDPVKPFLRGTGIDYDDPAYAERIEAVRKEHGLDGTVLEQYFRYLWNTIRFDYGTSTQYRKPVFELMFARIPWSLILSLTAMVISVTIGIIIGARAAKNRGKRPDKVLLGSATVTTALPAFWLAIVFLLLFAYTLPIFPETGAMGAGNEVVMRSFMIGNLRIPVFGLVFFLGIVAAVGLYFWKKKKMLLVLVPLAGLIVSVLAAVPLNAIVDILHHAVLPITAIAIGSIITYGVLVRNSMIAVVNEDYITTAKAKGLSERQILYDHTLRNALLPLVTSIGMSLAGIFSGSVLIEKIFAWDGMGNLLVEAQSAGDFPLSQGIMFFYSFVTVVANLITDFIYHRLDPRVKLA